MKLLFWFSFGIVFYNYAGYAVIVYIINKMRAKKEKFTDDFFLTVSFIVAAYNEEDCVEAKIKNCLSFIYPRHLIEFIFITDGSTDRTTQIVESYKEVVLLHQKERQGKSAALNKAVEKAKNEILIFNDANTIVNNDAVQKIVRHYHNTKTGGVAGEKKVISRVENKHGKAANEGLYWKYESFLKQNDSDFYSVVGAAGELFSLRKELYQPVEKKVILDDFVISLRVAQKNRRIIYEKDAVASEFSSASIKDEKKRKVRIAAGGFQAMVMLKDLLKFWKNPRLFFLYFSHRVLRWAASPFCLVLAFFSSLILAATTFKPFWVIIFLLQFTAYFVSLLVHFFTSESVRSKLLKIIYYFVFMNFSVLAGFVRFLRGNQSAMWEKVKRTEGV